MKQVSLVILSLTMLLSFRFAEDQYQVDIKKSELNWKAEKVIGGHTGSIKLLSGTLITDGNQLTGGRFQIDMRSIDVDELKGSSKQNLLNHLKSDNFFGVADNPVSTFIITKVSPTANGQVTIKGNLTIKGITHPLSFPATIKQQKKHNTGSCKKHYR